MANGIEAFDWSSYSCKVDAALSAEPALRLSQAKDYSIIITDMQIPHQSGASFIKRLRAINKYRKTPVILMSGHFRMPPSNEYGLYAENIVFIDKPFTLSNMRRIVGSLLHQART
ncbi:MAG: response regulator [Oligoflexales bacterium]|nr:response regulator [Oligoflexales bacterium]